MSDVVLISIITGIFSLASLMVSGLMAMLLVLLNRKATAASIKVDTVAEALVTTVDHTDNKLNDAAAKVQAVADNLNLSNKSVHDKLDGMVEVTNKTEKLCNSAMLAQKEMLMISARGKADSTKDKGDIALAIVAEKAYKAHKAEQDAERK